MHMRMLYIDSGRYCYLVLKSRGNPKLIKKFIFGFMIKFYMKKTPILNFLNLLFRSASFGYLREISSKINANDSNHLLINWSNSTLLKCKITSYCTGQLRYPIAIAIILAIVVRSASKFDSFHFLSTFM